MSAISVSGKPDVVMQDEDRSLLDGQASERPVERIAVVDAEQRIRSCRSVDRQDTDVRRPRAPTPGLGVARVDEQAPDPGFEAIRVTQGRELAPDGDEGALQGVLGETLSRRIRAASAYIRSLVMWTSAANASRSPFCAWTTRSRTVAPSVDGTVVAPSHPMSSRGRRNVQAVPRIDAGDAGRLGSGRGAAPHVPGARGTEDSRMIRRITGIILGVLAFFLVYWITGLGTPSNPNWALAAPHRAGRGSHLAVALRAVHGQAREGEPPAEIDKEVQEQLAKQQNEPAA